jgi:hypothetical protein
MHHLEHGPFKPQSAHERMKRLAGERAKNAMKVEGGEVG